MNNNFTFVIANSCDIPSLSTMVRSVQSKAWAKRYRGRLAKYADKFTNAGNDSRQTIGCLLHAAYGVNIGEQILGRLDIVAISKIRKNVLHIMYG